MMMLTVTQPAPYGHKSVHDLPTPPSTSRPSPPPAYQEQPHRGLSHAYQIPDQSAQLMSAPHRGLPPPAAMGLQPQQPPSNAASQPAHQSHPPPPPPSLSMPPHAHNHGQPSGHLPPPPQQWQGGEEHMKTWLVAKAEEEKTKQEEEKTRQEQLRLEQRKIEGDILRSSLSGGIPPPLIPLVFAGMGSSGGAASKTAMEWAQQYLSSAQGHHPQLLPAAGTVSPEHQRDYATPGGSQYPAGTPGPSGGLTAQGSFTSHAGSPTRPRGQTMSGPLGRVSSGLSNFPAGVAHQGSGSVSHQQQGPGHTQQGQQEPPLYFHHWQPPSTQGGSSTNPPGTPSGEVPRKRKAPGSQQPGSGTGDQRLRSPPVLMYSNPGTRGHKRQRSDMSWRHSSPGQGEWAESREPRRRSLSPQRELTAGPGRTLVKGEGGGHSVSSLLSAESEPAVDRYRPRQQTPTHQPQHYEPGPQRAGPAYARYVSEGQEDPRRTPPAPELSRGKAESGPRE